MTPHEALAKVKEALILISNFYINKHGSCGGMAVEIAQDAIPAIPILESALQEPKELK